jgi:hypothetical protein
MYCRRKRSVLRLRPLVGRRGVHPQHQKTIEEEEKKKEEKEIEMDRNKLAKTTGEKEQRAPKPAQY